MRYAARRRGPGTRWRDGGFPNRDTEGRRAARASEASLSVATIFDAHSFALTAHAGQLDKAGQPCMRHLERVANAALARAGHARLVDGLDVDPLWIMQAALLHDVLEDTPRTAADLRAAGFEPPVVEIVRILTKPAARIAYSERITQLIQTADLGAILVKMSDTEDNLGPSRIPPNAAFLWERYATAFGRLRRPQLPPAIRDHEAAIRRQAAALGGTALRPRLTGRDRCDQTKCGGRARSSISA